MNRPELILWQLKILARPIAGLSSVSIFDRETLALARRLNNKCVKEVFRNRVLIFLAANQNKAESNCCFARSCRHSPARYAPQPQRVL